MRVGNAVLNPQLGTQPCTRHRPPRPCFSLYHHPGPPTVFRPQHDPIAHDSVSFTSVIRSKGASVVDWPRQQPASRECGPSVALT